MRFEDILTPGLERIRAFRACTVGGRALRRNESAEVSASDARAAVARGDVTYATRLEVTEHIGPIGGRENVEPGIGAVIEVSSHTALAMERAGTGKPARPLDEKKLFPVDMGQMLTIRIEAPKQPPRGRTGFYTPGLFIPALGRFCSNGETHELPEAIARRCVASGFAALEPGQSFTPAVA